jgi:hypothetical protein
MDRDEINNRLEQAALAGSAGRSQMIDRVLNDEAGGARSLLNREAARDRAQLGAWTRVDASSTAVDAVAAEVELTAKWSGIDAGLVSAVADAAAPARRELPPSIHTSREAIDGYVSRSQNAKGAKAPDDPTGGMNRLLNTALANDLSYRVNEAYVNGYAARLNSGMEWLQASRDGRAVMEANTLASRVEAYDTLDRINDDVAAEVDFDDELRDPDGFAQRFVSGRMDAALVEAAYVAGRWSGTDPVIDHQLDVLTSRTVGIDAAPQVTNQDMRDVRFHFADQTLRGGEAGLMGMARAQTTAAAAALSPGASTAGADDLDAVRSVLRAQNGTGRAATPPDRTYRPPTAPETGKDFGR